MYFDARTIVQILTDPAAAEAATATIAETRRRFTSPLAVAEAILALGPDGTAAGQQVLDFLDSAGIEIRDMPPSHRLIEAATQPGAAGLAVTELLNRASADYYEAEIFSLDAAVVPSAPAAEPATQPAEQPAAPKA